MDGDDARTRAIDVVLDAPASVSIYLQALTRAGRQAKRAAVHRAQEDATLEALDELRRRGTWTTRTETGMPAPHTYQPTPARADVVMHAPDDSDELHSHLVLEGQIDARELERMLPAVRSRYLRVLGDALTADPGVRITTTGGRVQIIGVPDDLVEEFENRPCRVRARASQLRELHVPSAAS